MATLSIFSGLNTIIWEYKIEGVYKLTKRVGYSTLDNVEHYRVPTVENKQ